jgi:two-component system chemotaxis response regulator CheB
MIRLLVVDDSSFMIQMIKKVLNDVPDIVVVATAQNGFEALEKLEKYKPDCITMDINMPKLNGLETVKKIMQSNPVPIIMLSAHAEKEAESTMKALEFGAVDFLQKPGGEISFDLEKIKTELVTKIRVASTLNPRKIVDRFKPENKVLKINNYFYKPHQNKLAEKIIVIGVSTGGPKILKEMLPLFKIDSNCAIVISQHMPPGYTTKFAEQLDKITNYKVKEISPEMKILENHIYICPGDKDLSVKNNIFVLKEPQKNCLWTPSIDVMFNDFSRTFGKNSIFTILSGLGNDGSKGVCEVKRRGCIVIVQDKSTAIVNGMPGSAIKTGCVDLVLSTRLIPAKINMWLSNKNILNTEQIVK